MINFEAYNPTRVIFGEDSNQRIPELLETEKAHRIMLAYGGGSIKKNGIYQKIISNLANFEVTEFGGIEANPDYDTLMKAVELGKSKKVDFILAVGGGSVIDGVKFISGAMCYDGEPWDVLEKKEDCNFERAIPFGTFLTLPATGSEVNSGAVISRREFGLKRVMGGPHFFPKFSICDPTVVRTIPKRQLTNGIIDAYVHTLEQYLTFPEDNLLQEREAEAILSTLIEVQDVVNHPDDYKLAANLMLCASHALNGNLKNGITTDWATHMIGHELTALFDIDHAQTLAIIAPRLYENRFQDKREKLAQYGERVWGLRGSIDEIAKNAIEKTEAFFQSLGVKTRISDYTNEYTDCNEKIASIFEQRDWLEMGERKSITPQDVADIVKTAY